MLLRLAKSKRSVLIALAVLAMLASSLPLPIVERLEPSARWVANATGLSQNWSMFAPEVRNSGEWLVVRTVDPEGNEYTERLQDRRMQALGYRGYRWRAWAASAHGSGNCRVQERLAEHLMASEDLVVSLSMIAVNTSPTPDGQPTETRELLVTRRGADGSHRHQGEAACSRG